MSKEDKQKKFEEFYIKFVRKCLTENIMPTMTVRYDPTGVFPLLSFYEIDGARKKEILSS